MSNNSHDIYCGNHEESDVLIVEESSITDEDIPSTTANSIPKFEVVENGSKKNTSLLLDGKGFSYTVKSYFPKSKTWMCTRRSGSNPCRGSVRQVDTTFFETRQHNHEDEINLEYKVKVRKEVKMKALLNPFDSAKNIVEDVYIDFKRKKKTVVLPDEGNIIRSANRAREKSCPKNPTY